MTFAVCLVVASVSAVLAVAPSGAGEAGLPPPVEPEPGEFDELEAGWSSPNRRDPSETDDRIAAPDARLRNPTHDAATRSRMDGPGAGVRPVRLRIPAIAVDAPIGAVGLNDDRTIEVPGDFDQVGWYRHGPRPGERGPAVLLGHVDSHEGAAVFFHLRELTPGDEIVVEYGDRGIERFVVRDVEQHPKGAFPTERVYGDTPGSELRLITCGGDFDRAERSYDDNVIVWATKAT